MFTVSYFLQNMSYENEHKTLYVIQKTGQYDFKNKKDVNQSTIIPLEEMTFQV